MKKLLLVRTGAIGDMIMLTPVLRALKKDGWHITLFTTHNGWEIVKRNPNIDKVIFYDKPENDKELKWAQVEKIRSQYDEVINLSGQIESKLLAGKNDPNWNWSHEKRHVACNLNYVENQLAMVEHLEESTACELHFSPLEHSEAKRALKKYRGKFVIMWALAGSAFHKIYPYTEYVVKALIHKYPDIYVFTVGDAMASFLEFPWERVKNYCDKWHIRKSMLMTKYVQCVVGPETGVLNAAACYDTPKVVMLSHSSVENLTRDWINTTSLEANVACQPCHKLIFDLSDCPTDPATHATMCMYGIRPPMVFDAIEKEYLKWREKIEQKNRTIRKEH